MRNNKHFGGDEVVGAEVVGAEVSKHPSHNSLLCKLFDLYSFMYINIYDMFKFTGVQMGAASYSIHYHPWNMGLMPCQTKPTHSYIRSYWKPERINILLGILNIGRILLLEILLPERYQLSGILCALFDLIIKTYLKFV